MARRSTHRRHNKKATPSRGLFGYVYNPLDQTLRAAEDVTKVTANTLRNIARKGISGVRRVGSKVTGRADKAVRGLLMTKKRRQGGRR
jgi:hypothetical protein